MLCLVGTRASRDLLQLAGRVDAINAQKAVFHRKTAFFNIQPGKPAYPHFLADASYGDVCVSGFMP